MARGRRDHDHKKPNDQSTSRGSARRLRAASSLSAVVSWPGKQHDSQGAASLLAQASEIMASAGATGTARHAFADQADVLLQQALGFNTSTTSTTWAHLMELPFNASSTHSCDDLSTRRRELRASLAAFFARQPPLSQHFIQDVPRPHLLHDIEGVSDLCRADEAHDITVTLRGAQRFDLAARSGLSLGCVCQDSLAGGVPSHLVLHLVNLCEATHPKQAANAPSCGVTARRFVQGY